MFHMAKTGIIRFRCDEDLAARFTRVAALRRREESDLARLWFEDLVLAEEQRLGLVLSSSPSPAFQEIFDAGVAAATARGAQGGKPLPVQSVSYLAPAQKGRKSPRKPLKK